MAENQQAQPTATSWSSDLVGTSVDHSWDWQGESFNGLYEDFVDDAEILNFLSDTGSAWSSHPAADLQTVATPDSELTYTGLEGRPNSNNGAETHYLPTVSRFACDRCSKYFKSQKDVDRHRSSVHDKYTPYFCRKLGCRRSERGFSRKDNYEKHLRDVHREFNENVDRVKASRIGKNKGCREEGALDDYSRESLIQLVMEERERCTLEQRKRQEVEEELKSLRQRYEEREDMWLKILMAKDGK